jgi:acetyl esterase
MAYPGLDPALAPVVEELAKALPVPPAEMGIMGFRQVMAERAATLVHKRPAGLEVSEHRFDTPFGAVPARVYRPEGLGEEAAAMMYMHGGGWMIGDLNSHDAVCVDLALQAGAVVIALEYGVLPEHAFPVPVNQCHWVFHHLRQTAGQWRLDPARIAVGGDSAGGNMALAICLKSRAEGGAMPAAQLLIYPCVDDDVDSPSYRQHAQAPFLNRDGMIWIWESYLAGEGDRQNPLALPMRTPDFAGLPPAVVFTAALDPLAWEGDALAKRFVEDGVPVLHGRGEGLIHGFIRFREVSPASDAAFRRITAGVRMFLAR